MTRLHLVRHGPTHSKTMVGWSDLPADLSDTAALGRLDRFLPASAAIVSSDLSRASATADAIQGARARLPHQPGLREINFGDWELRSHAEIEAQEPDLARAYWETPGHIRPPGGESWLQVSHRANQTLDALIAGQTPEDIIVVAHFGIILTQVQRALRLDASGAFAHRIDNLSVTQVTRLPDGTWSAGHINHRP